MVKKNIVVSDVDGTIVKGSLILNHAVDLHDHKILDFGILSDLWKSFPKNENLITALAEKYRELIIGKNLKDLLVDDYIKRILSHPENFYSTLDRLIDFKNNGYRIVLVSGSPSYLVQRLAENFGFDYMGSNYLVDDRNTFTGNCVGMFTSQAKKEFLKTLGLHHYNRIIAFGDTLSDTPLFDEADYSVLVEPNIETHKKLSHLVQEVILQ